jgi:hypothetical protein
MVLLCLSIGGRPLPRVAPSYQAGQNLAAGAARRAKNISHWQKKAPLQTCSIDTLQQFKTRHQIRLLALNFSKYTGFAAEAALHKSRHDDQPITSPTNARRHHR